jgi:Phage integrase, N-terminal SAM-like domain
LAEFLTDEWLPAIEGTVRPSSYRNYERLVRKQIVPGIGASRLQAVSGGHLNALYRDLERPACRCPRSVERTWCSTAPSATQRDGAG